MSLKTDQLRYFVTVAEEGQITRAAKKLYIAQPALSQAIAQLESELGLQLLERHARGVRLTAAGAAFLEKARAVVDTRARREPHGRIARTGGARGARGRVHRAAAPAERARAVHRLRRSRTPSARSRSASCRSRAETRSRWLETVDVALCQHPDARRAGIGAFPVRVEPRALVVSATATVSPDAAELLARGGAGARPSSATERTFSRSGPGSTASTTIAAVRPRR